MPVIPRTRSWMKVFINALSAQMNDSRSTEHKLNSARNMADKAEAIIQEHIRVSKDLGPLPKAWKDWPWEVATFAGEFCLIDGYRLFASLENDASWTATVLSQGKSFEEVILVSKEHGSAEVAKAVAMSAAVMHYEGRLAAES